MSPMSPDGTDISEPTIERPPTPYEQAEEAACDDPSMRELANMVYDLPCVFELLVDGDDEDWRPTTITVGFDTDGPTGDVVTVMQIAGWRVTNVTWSPYNRVEFVERLGPAEVRTEVSDR